MHTGSQALPPPDMARIAMASHLSGLSRTCLYKLAGEQRIRFVKVGKTTLVDMVSVRAFMATLPEANIRAAA